MEKRRIDTFEGAVEYLYNMPRFTTKNTMDDTVAQLVRLGSPDRKIRHIIHVAGTNGKGSVCTYLRYCLQEAGYHVGVFTSPHLVDIRERFAVDGTLIDEEDFLRFFQEVYDSLDWEALQRGEGYHPTFFEYLFFMCMLYFAEKQPDYCILETGLGGRLDATNAVSHKELAVITRISLDHVEYLGDTVAQIAAEKAGIMKEGVPVVYCAEVPEAEKVFVKTARNMQARAVPVSKNDYMFHKFHNKTIDFSLRTRYYGYIGVSLHTIAHYQMENAALAVRALEVLEENGRRADVSGHDGKVPAQDEEIPCLITGEQLRRGLEKAFWPGRMEEILPITAEPAARAEAILHSGFLPRRLHRSWTERVPWRVFGLAASLLFFLAAAGTMGALATGRINPVPQPAAPAETPAPAAKATAPPVLELDGAERFFAVGFPDTQQEKAIRRALGNPAEEVYRWQLAEIRELYFCGNLNPNGFAAVSFDRSGVCRVNGAPVTQGQVNDLGLIADMARLEKLALICQPLTSISGLNGLTQLRELSLAGSKVESLSTLKELPSLEVLHLEHTGVRDLTSLEAFPNLKTVTVSLEMLPLSWNEKAAFAVILIREA